MALSITKSYADGSILTEADLDAIRTSIQDYINVTKLSSDDIQTGGVATANIADVAITTAKIDASAVTTAKIADANVTTAKILDANVTLAKLAASIQPYVQSLRSEIWVHSGNGHGSTNNKIRRFTTTGSSTGSAVTYADSAANGASFTIVTAGLYHISYLEGSPATDGDFGISVDSAQLTTTVVTATGVKDRSRAQNGFGGTLSILLYLAAGAVVRPHTDGVLDNTSAATSFRITQVAL